MGRPGTLDHLPLSLCMKLTLQPSVMLRLPGGVVVVDFCLNMGRII